MVTRRRETRVHSNAGRHYCLDGPWNREPKLCPNQHGRLFSSSAITRQAPGPRSAREPGRAPGARLDLVEPTNDCVLQSPASMEKLDETVALPATPLPPGGLAHDGSFTATRWTAVLLAGQSPSAEADAALASLCQKYWYPLYFYVCRFGHSSEDARDLVQGFFARLLEKDY